MATMTKEDATAIYDETASNERGRLYDEMTEPARLDRAVAEAHSLALLAVATEAARRERADVVAFLVNDPWGHRSVPLAMQIEAGEHVGFAKKGGA